MGNLFTKKLSFTLVAMVLSFSVFAQTMIRGTVKDETGPLPGVSILIKGSTEGTTSDFNGNYAFKTNKTGEQTLVFKFIGFSDLEKKVSLSGGEINVDQIELTPSTIGLKEINVIASVAIDRETPVAMSTLNAEQIETKLANQELPEVLNTTPGVYATKSGGGFGDSRINIRGFDQRNIAVLINGVPINDMENGWVYWSNWAGLGDAVSSIQVQRGLGASKLAISSVGGTMNIITKTTDVKKGGSFLFSTTDYGQRKAMVSLNSGRMDNGYAVSFVGSRTEGQSYIDGNYIDAWSYYLSVAKELNKNHRLQFTVIGAPQKHGQRDDSKFSALTEEQHKEFGTKHNPNWGYARGEFLNERNNYYHKPQIALNHYWNINNKAFLATSGYVSFGRGGGSGILGKNPIKYGPGQNELNQRNWNNALAINDTSTTGSYLIMRNSVNNHFWTGVLSTLKYDISPTLNFTGGIDIRYYEGEHYREVRDLLGGKYWADAVTPQAKVGDKVAYNNTGIVGYGGLFTQLEYKKDRFSSFLAAALSMTNYGRRDPYNFARGKETKKDADTKNISGYNFKAGANYKVNEALNVFVNAGTYSRAPFIDFVYLNFSNTLNPNIKNEIITAGELGLGYQKGFLSIRANGYYTSWEDRWKKSRVGNGTVYFQGLNQRHVGGELEATAQITNKLQVGGFASVGEWIYTEDTKVDIFDDQTQAKLATYTITIKDLKIADQPQHQFGVNLTYDVNKNLTIGGDFIYNDELYADFDPADRAIADTVDISTADRDQSLKLPGFGTVNAFAKYKFKIAGTDASFAINAYNILNKEYIAEGWDGRDHTMSSFRGFWGWGRNMNFALKINF